MVSVINTFISLSAIYKQCHLLMTNYMRLVKDSHSVERDWLVACAQNGLAYLHT